MSVVKNITFQPTERRACGTVAIIDDSNPEDPEPFAVTFEVPGDMGGVIIPPTTATAEITIIDDDGGESVTKEHTVLHILQSLAEFLQRSNPKKKIVVKTECLCPLKLVANIGL